MSCCIEHSYHLIHAKKIHFPAPYLDGVMNLYSTIVQKCGEAFLEGEVLVAEFARSYKQQKKVCTFLIHQPSLPCLWCLTLIQRTELVPYLRVVDLCALPTQYLLHFLLQLHYIRQAKASTLGDLAKRNSPMPWRPQ